jgi:predicted negative regulator of RcsB-dependent stress response
VVQDATITLSAADIVWICGAIISISAVLGILAKLYEKVKAPNQTQDERILKLENRVDEFDSFFMRDKHRLDDIEESNRITQEAIFALLGHALNGNNTEELENAKKDLKAYLIKRR